MISKSYQIMIISTTFSISLAWKIPIETAWQSGLMTHYLPLDFLPTVSEHPLLGIIIEIEPLLLKIEYGVLSS